MSRRIGRANKAPQTTIRVSVETRNALKRMLDDRLTAHAQRYRGGRQYGEPAPFTMDDVIKELMRDAKPKPDPRQLDWVPDARKTG